MSCCWPPFAPAGSSSVMPSGMPVRGSSSGESGSSMSRSMSKESPPVFTAADAPSVRAARRFLRPGPGPIRCTPAVLNDDSRRCRMRGSLSAVAKKEMSVCWRCSVMASRSCSSLIFWSELDCAWRRRTSSIIITPLSRFRPSSSWWKPPYAPSLGSCGPSKSIPIPAPIPTSIAGTAPAGTSDGGGGGKLPLCCAGACAWCAELPAPVEAGLRLWISLSRSFLPLRKFSLANSQRSGSTFLKP
mmetsp:Transcript_15036/g.37496  ORF Transcript_15036/g.37496 Transcript_15036/m.37496 type:complete len:244 (+) Transcript_15036:1867-2598(+)